MKFAGSFAFSFALLIAAGSAPVRAAGSDFYPAVDISMLPALEKAGAVYKDHGKPTDAIAIFAAHGWRVFRVRLFVKPDPIFNHTDGALQDLPYVRDLGKRIKSAGGIFLLDIHYSDTWADPGKQYKPAAWKNLPFDALVKQVHDYTASVLADLNASGASPDWVQVGNETTTGMIWPDGQVYHYPKTTTEEVQWNHYSQLLNAGSKAVREADTPDHKVKVVIHIDGGGKKGRSKWFFEKLAKNPVDFDIMGLSFYPAWDDSMDNLKQNMADVINEFHKDVFIAETSYPWKPMTGSGSGSAMQWPMSPQGQTQFLHDLTAAIQAAPDHHGIGYAWWYPEAVPTPSLHIWRGGAEALFDQTGNALPAMDLLGSPATRADP